MKTGRSAAPLRRDAVRSRKAIIEAARELFAVSQDVPMYEVARRAGVGQATLYRHFRDRVALAVTLAGEIVVELEELARRHAEDPDAFQVLFAGAVRSMERFHGLLEIVRSPAVAQPDADRMRTRLLDLFSGPLRVAHAAGTVRPDLRLEDVPILLAMVQGGLGEGVDPATRSSVAGRMIDILLAGVGPARP